MPAPSTWFPGCRWPPSACFCSPTTCICSPPGSRTSSSPWAWAACRPCDGSAGEWPDGVWRYPLGNFLVVAMDPVIRFRSAVALVGRFPVLAGVDLEVERGEVVLLQGANGAGKTSLLRACAGLLRVSAGEATVLGENLVVNPRAVRRKVGLFGHSTGLYDDLSAEDNARFAIRAAGGQPDAVKPAANPFRITGPPPGTPLSSLAP